MAFDARKWAGWSQEGEKPGQRVGVTQLPAQRTRAGAIHLRLAGAGDLNSEGLLGPRENECPFLSTKGAEGASFLWGAEQASACGDSAQPSSSWAGGGELPAPKKR